MARVFALFFEDDAGNLIRVHGTERYSLGEVKAMAVDRQHNGEAFPGERPLACGRVASYRPLSHYEGR